MGYQKVPTVNITPPPVTSNASAACTISQFRVSGITTINGGQGFNFPPVVTFSDPQPPVQLLQTVSWVVDFQLTK